MSQTTSRRSFYELELRVKPLENLAIILFVTVSTGYIKQLNYEIDNSISYPRRKAVKLSPH